jgi:hypothetical protein
MNYDRLLHLVHLPRSSHPAVIRRSTRGVYAFVSSRLHRSVNELGEEGAYGA